MRDFLHFLRHHVVWWVLPPLLILAALLALVWFGSNGGLAGFVYNV